MFLSFLNTIETFDYDERISDDMEVWNSLLDITGNCKPNDTS